MAVICLIAMFDCVISREQSPQFSWNARPSSRVQLLTSNDFKVDPSGKDKHSPSDIGLETVVRSTSDHSEVIAPTYSRLTTGQKGGPKMVTIGNNEFYKKHVFSVGDIDSNGFKDFIVTQPKAKNNSGSIRLYLMKENEQFLFSRELVPGKYGFEGRELQAGDMFGSSVFKLPSTSPESCVVAVGAPGDNAQGMKKGAIYILKIAQTGRVSSSSKVSADTDSSLARQHEENEGFGTHIKAIEDLNGDGDFELSVKSLLGSTTMLFLNAHHSVKTSLRVQNEGSAEMMSVIEKYKPVSSGRLDSTRLDSVSIRATAPKPCFFNETHCACGMKSAEKGSESCLSVVGTDPSTRRTLCRSRDCEPSSTCTCDGSKLCRRTEATTEAFTSEEPAGDGKVFCSKSLVKRSVNIEEVGIPIPTPPPMEVMSTFNATHCTCSPKKALLSPYECVDLLRTVKDEAIVCKSRDCAIGEKEYSCDGLGSSFCKRSYAKRTYFVNEGEVEGEPGQVYCHKTSREVEIVTLTS